MSVLWLGAFRNELTRKRNSDCCSLLVSVVEGPALGFRDYGLGFSLGV